MQVLFESLYDAIVDSAKVLPVLFLAYLLVSFLSHDHSHKFSTFLSKKSKTSVLFASFLGCIPQCGFSSVLADFYARRKVSLGTLFAVFIATSDEAIPIMASHTDKILPLLELIGIKLLLAIFWGYFLDGAVFVGKKFHKFSQASSKKHSKVLEEFSQNPEKISKISENIAVSPKNSAENTEIHAQNSEEHQHLEESEILEHQHLLEEHHAHCGHIHTSQCVDDCGHDHGSCCVNNVFLDAFLHTINILLYIFVATFALNLVVGYAGTDALASLLTTNTYLQVLLASLIGLFPNCASSVFLVELFLFGTLSFPALVAGLTAGAGVGLVILWTKNKKRPLENLGILLLQYIVGMVSGLVLTLFF